MIYRVEIIVACSDEHGWTADNVKELYEEATEHLGDFSAEVRVRRVEGTRRQPPCLNCGKADTGDDHGGEDGPNRGGYSCQKERPTLAQEVRAVKAKLRDDLVLVHADGGRCHGTRLVNRVCPGCGLCPDMQSMELWPPEQCK